MFHTRLRGGEIMLKANFICQSAGVHTLNNIEREMHTYVYIGFNLNYIMALDPKISEYI